MTPIFGMIHLPSLRDTNTVSQILQTIASDLEILSDLDYNGIIIENFGDAPFEKSRISDYIYAKLSMICQKIREVYSEKIGLNILRNCCNQAISLATAAELDFIRCNIWEGAYVTDQGIIEGVATSVMNLKRTLGSSVRVFADVHVKHATPMANFSIVESATHALGRGGADEVIISGHSTGGRIDFDDLISLNEHGIKPVIGSGLRIEDLSEYKDKIKAGIVGTAIKKHGVTSSIDHQLAKQFIENWRTHMG